MIKFKVGDKGTTTGGQTYLVLAVFDEPQGDQHVSIVTSILSDFRTSRVFTHTADGAVVCSGNANWVGLDLVPPEKFVYLNAWRTHGGVYRSYCHPDELNAKKNMDSQGDVIPLIVARKIKLD